MEYKWEHLYSIFKILKLMKSFIQITDTNNNILRSLSLGDLSSSETYLFRVWNNYLQEPGIGSLKGLELNLLYPPKQGIKTLVNNDVIKIRCTYSGERSETISMDYQTFPITNEDFNRLEPYCYNEYEVTIDFSSLSTAQKNDVDLINMEYNIMATYDTEFTPYSLPQEKTITLDSLIIIVTDIAKTSDTTIV